MSSNEENGSLIIRKVDHETGAPLSGVVFEIRNSDGEVIHTVISGDDGIDSVVVGLEPGSYTVQETVQEVMVVSQRNLRYEVLSQIRTPLSWMMVILGVLLVIRMLKIIVDYFVNPINQEDEEPKQLSEELFLINLHFKLKNVEKLLKDIARYSKSTGVKVPNVVIEYHLPEIKKFNSQLYLDNIKETLALAQESFISQHEKNLASIYSDMQEVAVLDLTSDVKVMENIKK